MTREQIKDAIKKSLGVSVERRASRLAAIIAAGEKQLADDKARPELRLLSRASRSELTLRLEVAHELAGELLAST